MALSGYGVYAEVTFAASAVDEAIPFLTVYLSDLPTAWHDAMANAGDTDGSTIRVTKSDGTTECAVYVPPGSVNTSTDTGALFFRATDLSAVLDTVYMIWVGNAASTMYLSTDTYGRNAVFTGYVGGYIPGMLLDDITGNGRTLIASATAPGTAASGYEGITAASYNGTSSYHYYDGTQAVTNNLLSFEALAYSTSSTASQIVAGYTDTSNTVNMVLLRMRGDVASDPVRFFVQGNGGGGPEPGTSVGYSVNTWHYAAGTRSTATSTGDNVVYLDGGNSGTTTLSINAPSARSKLRIGVFDGASFAQYLAGRVAFFGISSSARSANYVSTMNKNWLGTLYTVSAVMYVTGTTGKLKLQSAATTTASGSRADWATVTNALTIATDVATATVDETTIILSEFLELTNIAYNYAVPSGKSNYSITYYLTRRFQTGASRDIQDESARFIDESGAYAGTDMAIGTAWEAVVTTVTYTVSGVTLSDASFDASTGFALQVTGFNTNGNTEARVEFVCAEITWDEGAPATDYGNFFEAYSAFGNVA